ncbi:hypothetical protein [Bradyrhizobium sp.]|uniref:hypothetical protein n=1 Tax=Bradyrhizobium sp. TaxID=376 RepID=UPI003C746971
MTSPEMEGVSKAKHARQWWRESWAGETFMAVGMQDLVLGPPVMAKLREVIRYAGYVRDLDGNKFCAFRNG